MTSGLTIRPYQLGDEQRILEQMTRERPALFDRQAVDAGKRTQPYERFAGSEPCLQPPVVILAILQADSAYLLLNLCYLPKILREMARNAQVDLVFTHDACLDRLRLYLRLAHHWQWLNDGQYRHVSKIVAELGRLLGGWLKQTARAGQ